MVFYKKDLFSGEVWWIMFSNIIIITLVTQGLPMLIHACVGRVASEAFI